ncbi:hypothetical protein SAMN05444339_10243 [Loktanella atrilutea]|uniref:Uncharacterized protein n=1 Tax=Loktanella atrilutea TaxID=366533 RepID=A0A1M4W9Y5_LOKAT|nr:hypothetical protein [Loktanella atrilutea]SHE78081.1 hypothetical protein SAMN05444339_10243 [Loktanella atrilutea]
MSATTEQDIRTYAEIASQLHIEGVPDQVLEAAGHIVADAACCKELRLLVLQSLMTATAKELARIALDVAETSPTEFLAATTRIFQDDAAGEIARQGIQRGYSIGDMRSATLRHRGAQS